MAHKNFQKKFLCAIFFSAINRNNKNFVKYTIIKKYLFYTTLSLKLDNFKDLSFFMENLFCPPKAAGRVFDVLKSYGVEELREGMKIGRDILDADGSILLGKGTTLTSGNIESLLDRPIFSVYVEEDVPEVEKEIPGKEHLLDDEYVRNYDLLYSRLHQLYIKLLDTNVLDMDELTAMTEHNLPGLCNGAKAVSQIHNMSRDGIYLIHHVLHVAILAGLMGGWLRWTLARRKELITAALLMDVGQQRISKDILERRGTLSPSERAIIQKHPDYAYDMLRHSPIGENQNIICGITQHHERCDGSGYPNRLKRDQITDNGRILAILDIYDAMATNRVYARRRSPFDVFGVLYDNILSGKLDTEYGVHFLKNLCHSLNGNWVGLSNGEKGRIVYIDESRVTSLPIVQTTTNKFIDLNTNTSVKIQSILTANEVD